MYVVFIIRELDELSQQPTIKILMTKIANRDNFLIMTIPLAIIIHSSDGTTVNAFIE